MVCFLFPSENVFNQQRTKGAFETASRKQPRRYLELTCMLLVWTCNYYCVLFNFIFVVAKEICKLALDYMTNGSNNRFQTFASKSFYWTYYIFDVFSHLMRTNHNLCLNIGKINTTTSSLQDVINALIMLQCKSVQTNVSSTK